MVLQGPPCGRVGRHRIYAPDTQVSGASLLVLLDRLRCLNWFQAHISAWQVLHSSVRPQDVQPLAPSGQPGHSQPIGPLPHGFSTHSPCGKPATDTTHTKPGAQVSSWQETSPQGAFTRSHRSSVRHVAVATPVAAQSMYVHVALGWSQGASCVGTVSGQTTGAGPSSPTSSAGVPQASASVQGSASQMWRWVTPAL
jgi:hypothetical protein